MSDEQHKLSSSSRLDSFIPLIWYRETLKTMLSESLWNERMRELGYEAAQIPVPPRHVRLWRTTKWFVQRRREDLALKIAPWLDRDPYR